MSIRLLNVTSGRWKLVVVMLMLLLGGSGHGRAQCTMGWTDSDSLAVRMLQDYMWRYPQSQLRDVYKFCFQDVFGLEHLLNDSLGAVRYMEREMSESDKADWQQARFVYPLTLTGDYVRVDVGFVRDGSIPIGTMVSAMLQSVGSQQVQAEVKLAVWRQRWQRLVRLLEGVQPRPLNFDEDREMIERQLDLGQYAVHHSKLFNQTYKQHYRIVRRDVFERMLAPLIQKTTY